MLMQAQLRSNDWESKGGMGTAEREQKKGDTVEPFLSHRGAENPAPYLEFSEVKEF